MKHAGRRFRVEAVLAVVATILAVVTAISPEWIEWVSGFDPDRGSGLLEWMVVAALGLVAVVMGALARVEWGRHRSTRHLSAVQ